MIYNRNIKKHIEENEEKADLINFLYTTKLGIILLKIIVLPFFSKIAGIYYKSRFSKHKINKFIAKYNIEIKADELVKYKSFNDFFTRRKEVNINTIYNMLISPAQSKLTVYNIDNNLNNTIVNIKGSRYKILDIINDDNEVKEFIGGYCLVFRLSTTDYHRYIYIDNGFKIKSYHIKGKLHTIRDNSLKYKVYSHNSREITIINGYSLGRYIQIEVGALTVGKIRNYNKINHNKGEEKGYFEYGGSTIVLLIQKDKISIDKDIIEQSNLGIETIVNIGEAIGMMVTEEL